MKMIRTLILLTFLAPALSIAAGGSKHITHIKVDVTDRDVLQRGAKYYFNYCAGCHSIKFMSYKRLQQDLGLTEKQVRNHFMMTYGDDKKISNYITTSMTKKQGKALFENAPPDLSTIARARGGASWLYSYLTTFYVDPKATFGMNNLVFKNVGMPHVMLELQGKMVKVVEDVNGKKVVKLVRAKDHGGSMSLKDYNTAVKELVTFLVYVGEPNQAARYTLGFKVVLFLIVFTFFAYLMKKEYWKDVH